MLTEQSASCASRCCEMPAARRRPRTPPISAVELALMTAMRRTVPTAETSQAKCGHLPFGDHAWCWSPNGADLPDTARVLWRSWRALAELVSVLLDDEV